MGPLVLALFKEVDDSVVRASIIMMLPFLADRSVTVRILRRVLTEETPWEGIPALAIESLAKLGEPGRAVLRELHAQEAVSVWRARRRLEDVARHDFRIGGGGGGR